MQAQSKMCPHGATTADLAASKQMWQEKVPGPASSRWRGVDGNGRVGGSCRSASSAESPPISPVDVVVGWSPTAFAGSGSRGKLVATSGTGSVLVVAGRSGEARAAVGGDDTAADDEEAATTTPVPSATTDPCSVPSPRRCRKPSTGSITEC